MTPAKRPADQAIRDRVVSDFTSTIVLEAGAGTGKTTVLVARIVALVKGGAATLDRIVAITFTEKAAGELKMRLRDELEKSAAASAGAEHDRCARALSDLERAPVSTIHAFAGALLRERPFEAGVDPGFAIAAEVAGERTFTDAWNRWLDERMSEGHPELVRAIHLGLDLSDLERAARSMVENRDLLCGPVRRAPFTPAALLSEVTATLARLAPMKRACIDRDDKAYQSILAVEAFAAHAARLKGPSLERELRELHVQSHLGRQAAWKTKDACRDVKAELKSLSTLREAYELASNADVAATLRELLRGFATTYESVKREGALLDFQDLLLRARDLLAGSLPVRRYFQRRFDRILIDEFQDTDPLQTEIAFYLAGDPDAPGGNWRELRLEPGKLFVVGDPKQSIYRFRRADLRIYDEVKRLIVAQAGVVLPLTTNFRTVPSVLAFVNERFAEIFTPPNDPEPRALDDHRAELDKSGARTVALALPEHRMPQPQTNDNLLPLVADTVAAFVDHVTRVAPWTIADPRTGEPRAARPGDVALLVRKMTPAFVAPFEDALRRRGIGYRLVGGKEYYAREEIQALTAALRAIDNPADRLSLVVALKSAFFGASDDELVQWVAADGALHILAPAPELAKDAPLASALALLGKLHRQRRVDPPSVVIEALFASTRGLASFALRPGGAQMVANLWKVLEVARAYERTAPTTLRAFARFLEEEAQSGREEGDSPVGEHVGAAVEVVTVHRAKGLEYPIVVVADMLTSKSPAPTTILDHAGGQGWLSIGGFQPAGWAERLTWDATQEAAENRRLLYVALTRARDHLVIPCLPGARKDSWMDAACAGFVEVGQPPPLGKRSKTLRATSAGAAEVTWFDTRKLDLDVPPESKPRAAIAIEGSVRDAATGLAAEQSWSDSRDAAIASGRHVVRPTIAATTLAGATPRGIPSTRRAVGAHRGPGLRHARTPAPRRRLIWPPPTCARRRPPWQPAWA